VSEDDLLDVVLPKLSDTKARAEIKEFADALVQGRSTISGIVDELSQNGAIPPLPVPSRSGHVVQV
jgi:hypothetical protein